MTRIKVAYCFDHNLIRQVRVVVASLLDAAKIGPANQSDGTNTAQSGKNDALQSDKTDTPQIHYDIYCVCTKEAAAVKDELAKIVEARDPESKLYFIDIENSFEKAYEVRGISSGAYLRLELPGLLKDVDKIIYMDIDTLVQRSLLPMWETDMQDYLLAGVRAAVNISDKWEWNSDRPYWHMLADMKGRYVNSGVLLMNLRKMREEGLKAKWDELAKIKMYYQDQDMLNITCKDALYQLPAKYNRYAYFSDEEYRRFVEEGMMSSAECTEATEHPAIIHFAGDKPWKRYDGNLCSLWWDYVNTQSDLQGLFDEKKARRYHGPTLLDRALFKVKKLLSKEKL